MKYDCTGCGRAFYLETDVASPCPACGTMLTGEGDAPPAQEAAPEPAAPEPAVEAPAAPVPSAQTWIMPSQPQFEVPAEEPAYEEPQAAEPPPLPPTTTPTYGFETAPSPEPEAEAPPADSEAATGLNQSIADALDAVSDTMPPSPRAIKQSGAVRTVVAGDSAPVVKVLFYTLLTILVVGGAAFGILSTQGYKIKPTSRKTSEIEEKLTEKNAELEDRVKTLDANLLKENKLNIAQLKKVAQLEVRANKAEAALKAQTTLSENRLKAVALASQVIQLKERRTDLSRALIMTDEAIKLEPNFAGFYRIRGDVLNTLGHVEQAVEAYKTANEIAKKQGAKGDAESLLLAAEALLLDSNGVASAKPLLKMSAEISNKNAYSLVAKARLELLAGQVDMAIKSADNAAKADIFNAYAPLLKGEALLAKSLKLSGDAKRNTLGVAERTLASAVKLAPNMARANLMRGKALIEQTRIVASSMGFGVARMGPQSRAETSLSAASRLKPNLLDAHIAMAELRLVDGALFDPTIALTRARHAVSLSNRKNARALALLAEAEAANGNPSGALKAIKDAMLIAPKDENLAKAKNRFEADVMAMIQ